MGISDAGEPSAGILCSVSLRWQLLRLHNVSAVAAGNSEMCLMHISSDSAR